jgi:hypothetical protein
MQITLLGRRPRPSTRGILLVAAGWAITVAVGLTAVTIARSGPAVSRPERSNSLGPPNYAQPLVNARQTTVAGAAAAAGFRVPVPSHALASRADLSHVWVNKQLRQVALVFAGGKITIMMWPASYRDPLASFRLFIAQNHASAAIRHVLGRPALVITPHTDVPRTNPAWVEFDRNGVDINLVSTNYDTAALLAIAASLY